MKHPPRTQKYPTPSHDEYVKPIDLRGIVALVIQLVIMVAFYAACFAMWWYFG